MPANQVYFRTLATRCGAVEVEPFNHDVSAAAENTPGGLCYGLSSAFLLHCRRVGLMETTSFSQSAAISAAISTRTGNTDNNGVLVYRCHRHQQVRDDHHQMHQQGLNVFGEAGLQRREIYRIDHGRDRPARVARHMLRQRGYYLIQTPAHAVAFFHGAPRSAFFDPNFGIAWFDNPDGVVRLMRTLFGLRAVRRAYRGVRGGFFDAPDPHRTYHFRVERYA